MIVLTERRVFLNHPVIGQLKIVRDEDVTYFPRNYERARHL
jgi:hypothetical protein